MSGSDPQSPKVAPQTTENGQAQANGATISPAEKKVSGAEAKKLKQQKKAAERAARKEAQGSSQTSQPSKENQTQPQKQQSSKEKSPKPTPEKQSQSPRPQQQATKARRPSETKAKAPAVKAPIKQVRLFSHLYGQPRRHNIVGAKDIHPAILALGLQMSSYEICGSNARCVAMLLAFKSVCQSPSGNLYKPSDA